MENQASIFWSTMQVREVIQLLYIYRRRIWYFGEHSFQRSLFPYTKIITLSEWWREHYKHFVRISTILTSKYFDLCQWKSAIEVVTRILAEELGSRKIRVNKVAPCAVATDFNGGTVRDNEKVNQMVASVTALGRSVVPDDIGGVIAFLCTEDARWINGQRIEVSGGMHL